MFSPDTEKQAAVFDAIGEQYDAAFAHKAHQEEASRWLAAQVGPQGRVLDAGCGSGLPTSRLLTEAGCQVLGIDISEGMLQLARRNVPGARFERMNLADPALQEGSFDGVAAFFSLLMLPRAQVEPAVRRLGRLLRPGGTLVLSMVEEDLDYVPIPFLGQTLHVSALPRAELAALLERGGLQVLRSDAVDFEASAPGAPPERQLFFRCRRQG